MSQESEKKKDPNPNNIGGQAVIEGVMMRGKEIYAMAVRNPEGGITVEKKEWGGLGKKGLFRFPIFRGISAFWDSLVTGTKILMRSAEIAGEDWTEEELSPFEKFLQDKLGDKINDILIYFSVCLSLVLGMLLFCRPAELLDGKPDPQETRRCLWQLLALLLTEKGKEDLRKIL